MKDPTYERLREAGWRRKLTTDEEAELRAWLLEHPDAGGDFEADRELTEALGKLPDAPMPSNFTARVLQQLQREERAQPDKNRSWFGRWHLWLKWLPRVAVASVVVAAGLLSYHHAQETARKERAATVQDMVSFTAIPGPDILQDYDAIQAMSQSPAPDLELLKALQ